VAWLFHTVRVAQGALTGEPRFGGNLSQLCSRQRGPPTLRTPSCRGSARASFASCDKDGSSAAAVLQPGRDKRDYSRLLDGVPCAKQGSGSGRLVCCFGGGMKGARFCRSTSDNFYIK